MTTAQYTISEALAETKLIPKKMDSKLRNILPYLTRSDDKKDPLESSGGSIKFIAEELQSYFDLCEREVNVWKAIRQANEKIQLTIEGVNHSIADWILWRRVVADHIERFYGSMQSTIHSNRHQLSRQNNPTTEKLPNLIVNYDEKKLAQEIEKLENILGVLDGKLSLLNATNTVEV